MQPETMQPIDDPVRTAVEGWKASLLDMSTSNPLLDFHPDGDFVLPLVQPTAARIIAGLTAPGADETMTLVREATPAADRKIVGRLRGPANVQPVGGVLREMHNRATDAFLAKGVSLLYATFGLLHWELADGSHRSSPLLLLRVRLDRQPIFADYTLTAAEPVPRLELNPVLVNQVRAIWDLSLDDLPQPYALDDVKERILDQIADADHMENKVNWRVTDEAFLGLFPLEDYILYEDVERHQVTISNHPVIRALAKGEKPLQPVAAPASGDNPWQVVDADASQRKAIAAVGAGGSLVIEGPPGTGKSQTITNLIAQALGNDQTVLFVSEKMAALEVVAKRLGDVGLDPYCLALHTEVNDRTVLKGLEADSGAGMPAAAPDSARPNDQARAVRNQRLAELRRQIDGYFTALTDANNAWQRSAYDVIGEIANLARARRIRFDYADERLGELTADHARLLQGTIKTLAALEKIAIAPDAHMWREFDTSDTRTNQRGRYALEERLDSFLTTTQTLHDRQHDLRNQWGLPAGESLEDARWLVTLLAHVAARGARSVRRAWFEPAIFHDALKAAGDGAYGNALLRDKRARLSAHFAPAVIDDAWLDAFRTERASPRPLMVAGQDQAGQWQPPARIGAGLALATLRELGAAARDIAGILGMEPPTTVSDIRLVLELATMAAADQSPCHDWFLPDRMAPLKALALDAQQKSNAIAQGPNLLASFRPGVLEIDQDGAMLNRLDDDASVLDQISVFLRRDLSRIGKLKITPGGPSRDEAARALVTARNIREAQLWYATHDDELDAAFGPFYHGPKTTGWDITLHALDVAARTRHLVNPNDPPASLVDESSSLTVDKRPLDRLVRALHQAASAWTLYREAVPQDQVPVDDAFERTAMATIDTELTTKLRGANDLLPLCVHLAACRLAPWTSFNDLVDDMKSAEDILADDNRLRDLFGDQYRQERTDWNGILDALQWVDGIQRMVPAPVPATFADRTLGNYDDDARTGSLHLTQAIDAFTAARQRLLALFIPGGVTGGFIASMSDDKPLTAFYAWARELRDNVPELNNWLRYQETAAQAEHLGLTPFLDAVREASIPARDWSDSFDLQLATLWLGWRQRNALALDTFAPGRADAACAEFARLDDEWQRDNAQRLVAHLAARRAAALAGGHLRPEVVELRKAAQAFNPPPLRQVLGAMPNLLPTLKPCLLMSPAAVARYLGDRSATFNLIVFDEASQIMTADVLGAIARGRQTVVVGDSRQLPPTRFFKSANHDDTVSAPSLLDQCEQAAMDPEWLLWHYRSQYEDLITYPNKAFYGNRLVTFPSPRQDIDPIELVRVEGNYEQGSATNRAEAAKVVDVVIDYARAKPTDSIGIITFSEAQQAVIQHELDDRRHADEKVAEMLREDGPHALFVRNLERVQGDERDAIFFSIGYGPNAHGVLSSNFGPLNAAGGDRRLNVAITRARKKVIIVCSFDPRDLLGNKNENVQKLGEYLIFAGQTPGKREEQTPAVPEASDKLQDAVAKALQDHGLHVIRNVGRGLFRVDIGVLHDKDSARCVLGIDCDGSVWQAAPDIRDRERLRPKVLERNLHWTLHRVWSLDWQNQREAEIERILHLVQEKRREIAQQELQQGTADDEEFTIILTGGEPPATPPSSTPTGTPTATPPVEAAPPDHLPTPVDAEPPAAAPRPFPRTPSAPTPAAKPRTPVKKPAEERPKPRTKRDTTTPAGASVGEIKGLSVAARKKLAAAGITTTEALLAAAATDKERDGLATRLEVDPAELRGWVHRADLMRIPGVGPEFANLLEEGGIASCRELRQRNPENLHDALTALNEARSIAKRVPSLAQLTTWIDTAGTLADSQGKKP